MNKTRMHGLGVRRIILALVGISIAYTGNADQIAIPDYTQARILFWSKVYPKGGETLYCAEKFRDHRHSDINIEHVFPMAWTLPKFGCVDREQCRSTSARFRHLEADLYNLFPARMYINRVRGNLPFGMIAGEKRDFGNCDFEVDYYSHVVEPRPAARGEIARAMFYMYETYGLVIYARLGRTLKQWNHDDPPSEREKQRNDTIEKLQGTRNRFIDNPAAADKLWF
jgi:deoxyribonuclease I